MKAAATGVLSAPVLIGACALAGCAADSWVTPGTGWSRASDLSVYGAMDIYGEVAREQAILCQGFAPAGVTAGWARDFGAREAAVTAALAARHGEEALAEAEAAAVASRPIPCAELPDGRWRRHYARLLRLLETRLGLA
jgi:hypothetical protein